MAKDLLKEILNHVPNHYELLDLKLFESDKDKIKQATLDCTKKVKEWEGSIDRDTAENVGELRANVSRAFAELSDEMKKRDYDAELAKKLDISLPDSEKKHAPDPEKTTGEQDGVDEKQHPSSTTKNTGLEHESDGEKDILLKKRTPALVKFTSGHTTIPSLDTGVALPPLLEPPRKTTKKLWLSMFCFALGGLGFTPWCGVFFGISAVILGRHILRHTTSNPILPKLGMLLGVLGTIVSSFTALNALLDTNVAKAFTTDLADNTKKAETAALTQVREEEAAQVQRMKMEQEKNKQLLNDYTKKLSERKNDLRYRSLEKTMEGKYSETEALFEAAAKEQAGVPSICRDKAEKFVKWCERMRSNVKVSARMAEILNSAGKKLNRLQLECNHKLGVLKEVSNSKATIKTFGGDTFIVSMDSLRFKYFKQILLKAEYVFNLSENSAFHYLVSRGDFVHAEELIVPGLEWEFELMMSAYIKHELNKMNSLSNRNKKLTLMKGLIQRCGKSNVRKLRYGETSQTVRKPQRKKTVKKRRKPTVSHATRSRQTKKHTCSFSGSTLTLIGKTSSGITRRFRAIPKFKCKVKCFNHSVNCWGTCFNLTRLKKDIQKKVEKSLSHRKGLPLMFQVKVYSKNGWKHSNAEIELVNGIEMMSGLVR